MTHLLLALLAVASPKARKAEAVAAYTANPAAAYAIATTRHGYRYFFTTPAPCTCAADAPTVICAADLDARIAASLRERDAAKNTECLPSAGCAMGKRELYVECGAAAKAARPGTAPTERHLE